MKKTKFSFIYMGLLTVFILVGIGFIFFYDKEGQTPEIDDKLISKTPGLASMLSTQDILEKQLLSEHIVNIEVQQENQKDHVTVELGGNDFATEESILKDTYNIYTDAASIQQLAELTIIWSGNVNQQTATLLKVSFNKQAMAQLSTENYEQIPNLANLYEKNNLLK
jgi:hypothetical protein